VGDSNASPGGGPLKDVLHAHVLLQAESLNEALLTLLQKRLVASSSDELLGEGKPLWTFRMELELSGFHLPTALDSALTLVRERAGRRGIVLQMNVDEGLGQIHADERKVRQVVLNLLSNAIKFTPEGGRIEVRASPQDGLVEVSVSDTGVGIAPADPGGGVRGVPPGGDRGQEGRGHWIGIDPVSEVCGTPRRQDLGQERTGKRLDLHFHDPGASWRMS
jgi:Histidine kinase-, DNA gyrase B-, and HSP90-like ATPase